MSFKIIFSKRLFKDTKKLKKKFKNIEKDLLNFTNLAQKGKISGNRIKGLGSSQVYKARIQNSSIKSGKSSGFRMIYYVQLKKEIYFLTLYSKSEKGNIKQSEILKILKQEELI